MTRLIIFDIDGTLVTTKSGETFRVSAGDWQWLPGRLQKCHDLASNGTYVALATNQAGVAFPWSKFTESEITAVVVGMVEEMGAHAWAMCCTSPNIKALPQYFNPNDRRRKPGPGMIEEIMEQLGCSPAETLYVGDRPEDEQAARAAGVAFQWADDFFEQPD